MRWRPILAYYPAECQMRQVEPLGMAGGFSGARFWRLAAPCGLLCLRRWPPEHPTPDGLRQIHGLLRHVWDQGFRLVPRPLAARDGRTFIEHEAALWELTPWLPGQADYCALRCEARLRAAMRTLGEFHLAAASYVDESLHVDEPLQDSLARSGELRPRAAAPGLGRRLARLHALLRSGLAGLRHDVNRNGARWPDLATRAQRLFELFECVAGHVERTMSDAAPALVPLQWCIGDIWHDHVLFTGDMVTGLIDFGAVRRDSVAADVARLLGSLARDDPSDWRIGLAAYEDVRRLMPEERALVRALDESSVLMSGLSWLEWVFGDGRRFDSSAAVIARVDENLERLANLAAGFAWTAAGQTGVSSEELTQSPGSL
jgi:homoserine kinase type II